MVWNMKIEVIGLDGLQKDLKRWEKAFPMITHDIMDEFGKESVIQLRRSLIVSTPPNGKQGGYLYNNIKYWVKNDYMKVTVPEYGLALDNNNIKAGHWTEIRIDRIRMRNWIKERGFAGMRKKLATVEAHPYTQSARRGFWAKSYPWISQGVDIAESKLTGICRTELDKRIN